MPISFSAHVVVFKKNSVLLIRRSDSGFWAVPGGRIEENESIQEAAIREVNEECGFRPTISGICGVFSNPEWDDGIHSIVFRGEIEEAIPNIRSNETSSIGFFEAEELPQELLFWHRQYIKAAVCNPSLPNRLFRVRSPSQILRRKVDYDAKANAEEREKLRLHYLNSIEEEE